MLGQIATLMESLHLTRNEVVKVIPFRDLLLMLKDKQHTTYGDVYEEVSEDEFFAGKKKPY